MSVVLCLVAVALILWVAIDHFLPTEEDHEHTITAPLSTGGHLNILVAFKTHSRSGHDFPRAHIIRAATQHVARHAATLTHPSLKDIHDVVPSVLPKGTELIRAWTTGQATPTPSPAPPPSLSDRLVNDYNLRLEAAEALLTNHEKKKATARTELHGHLDNANEQELRRIYRFPGQFRHR